MSLGCEATMSIRLKKKYLSIKKINWSKYDPKKPVIAGSRFAEERLRLNKMYNERVFNRKDLERLKTEVQAKVCADKTNFASPCLTMKLKHGDMVVMHGSAIQKYYEVCSKFHFLGNMPTLTYHSTGLSRKGLYDLL